MSHNFKWKLILLWINLFKEFFKFDVKVSIRWAYFHPYVWTLSVQTFLINILEIIRMSFSSRCQERTSLAEVMDLLVGVWVIQSVVLQDTTQDKILNANESISVRQLSLVDQMTPYSSLIISSKKIYIYFLESLKQNMHRTLTVDFGEFRVHN